MNNSNSGHAKNVANLIRLNQAIDTLGNAYNPVNPSISKTGLQTLLSNAQARLGDVENALANWQKATNAREIAFVQLPQLSTRLLAALSSLPVTQQTLDDFGSLANAMRSVKLSKADAGKTTPAPGATEPAGTTVSQAKQSFDARLELFGRMVLLLDKEPLYEANEPAMSKAGLKAKLEELKGLNEAANNSYSVLRAARIARNQFFYQNGGSLLDCVRQVKAYVKGLFGAGSQHSKTVAAIRFVRVVPVKKAK